MVQPVTGTLLGAQSELPSDGQVEINLYVTLDTNIAVSVSTEELILH